MNEEKKEQKILEIQYFFKNLVIGALFVNQAAAIEDQKIRIFDGFSEDGKSILVKRPTGRKELRIKYELYQLRPKRLTRMRELMLN